MTCDQRHDLMPLYAADALDPAERDEVRAHLATGCPRCAGSLTEAQAVVASLPLSLPPVAPSPAAISELLRRVAASAAAPPRPSISPSPGRRSDPPPRTPFPWRPVFLSGLSAAAAVALVSFVLWPTVPRRPDVLRSSDLQFISLTGSDPQPVARGRILWDKDTNDWHVAVFDMKPPPPGRTYELWFITPAGQKIPAGTFLVDAKGQSSLTVHVPPAWGPLSLAAITDEPAGGVTQPTGAIQLVGKL